MGWRNIELTANERLNHICLTSTESIILFELVHCDIETVHSGDLVVVSRTRLLASSLHPQLTSYGQQGSEYC